MSYFRDSEKATACLVESGAINDTDLESAKSLMMKEEISMAEALVRLELLKEDEIVQILADAQGFKYVVLAKEDISPEVFEEIPELVAQKNKIVAFRKDEKGLHVAMADPTNLELRDFIERKEGLELKVYAASKEDIENVLQWYGGKLSDELKKTLASSDEKKSGEVEPPIVNLVSNIVSFAYKNRASDIHIEPRDDGDSVIRFRIDGVLHDVSVLPKALHGQVVSRIKVLAKLRTDEHQIPQDGKIRFPLKEEDVDIRVSIVPITEGENMVLRLLSERSRQFSLVNLGLVESDLKKIKEAYERPHGMILSTGPTGSGKTTTLYAMIKLLNSREVNIMTIEDPVEYDMDGVNQIQVNTKAELTFATGLRSILRQDPNIILVGEIRDKETAGIAINLAMTGHLILSTLHTNDASTAIPRFVDLGIEPFLIASTVNCIIGQRLVRKTHDACMVSEEVSIAEIAKRVGWEMANKVFGGSKDEAGESKIRLYKGKGCKACRGTGYEGRIGIFEVLVMDDEIKKLLIDNQDAGSIEALAKKNGMRTMLEDGLEKVKDGLTTIDEVLGAAKS